MAKTEAPKRFYSNPGSVWAPVHKVRIDNNGHKTLVDTGEKTNIYEKIISHRDEVDIEALWERCQMEGYQILDRKKAISGDVTMVPNSLLEAAQILQDRENEFNQLPLEIREKFNHSFDQYIAEAGNDFNSWASKMGVVKETTPNQPKVEGAEEGGSE